MSRARGGHVLATVLFTDIVDSSRIATELGDRRWRVLLAHHHDIVRKTLKRHGGKEVDNAGDGFFAAFDDQADAIRCACEISNGVRVLGVDAAPDATWVRPRWWVGSSAGLPSTPVPG
jgi:class 3 adenylate cyclase